MRFLLLALALGLVLPLRAAEPAAEVLTAQAWLLDGLHIRPEAHPQAAAYRRQLGQTHPVGAFFIQLDMGGSYTLIRGADLRESGKWSLVDGVLQLQRSAEGKPVAYRVISAAPERLVLAPVLPAGAPEAHLEFSPAKLPQ